MYVGMYGTIVHSSFEACINEGRHQILFFNKKDVVTYIIPTAHCCGMAEEAMCKVLTSSTTVLFSEASVVGTSQQGNCDPKNNGVSRILLALLVVVLSVVHPRPLPYPFPCYNIKIQF